ncbi:hypothetical protein ABZ330_18750 [Streptomyces sp. NPDC006172]|uniref:hypothetical protein n=1 Tax=Streptomyces sp. NPDC006172 TaxID=3154470 RepID=UPI00340475E8
MTQSGQGEEPSARPAHEGIVLPSDGGEPLLPGMTNASYSRPRPHEQQQPSASAPGGGQTWGQPWGPEQQQSGQGWPLPADQQQWGAPQGAGPDAWTQQSPDGAGAPARPAGAGPLPPEGAPAPSYGQGMPGAPLPPASAPGSASADEGATQYIPPVPSGHGGDYPAAFPSTAFPPAASADEGATQYLPPVPGGGHDAAYHQPHASADDGATQYIPPVPSGPADEGATQYIPPVRSGALPPETPSESTHYLGRAGASPDAEATQYIPPVTGQGPYGGGAGGADRQPPTGFENLFRDGPAGDGPEGGSTQQMPRISEPEGPGHGYPAAPQPSYTPPGAGSGGRRGGRDEDHGRGRNSRTGSRLPMIAAIGVGIAVVGVGAGALLGAGGDGGDKGDDNKTVAASAPTAEGSASASADGAEQQAIALDKLLSDSGSSRATVISAVADVKACTDLAQAATDLRGAAQQRAQLVTKLSALSVDQLPDHAALTDALTKAWQASASADDHYAAWADQVAGDKQRNCKKGQARSTPQTQAGNRASGTASTQKTRAAKVWNEIARKYGLTERQPVQL